MENKPRGQFTWRACELFDQNNRLGRSMFCLCSTAVSNKSSDKLTDTTNLDGEHKKLLCETRCAFHRFFVDKFW